MLCCCSVIESPIEEKIASDAKSAGRAKVQVPSRPNIGIACSAEERRSTAQVRQPGAVAGTGGTIEEPLRERYATGESSVDGGETQDELMPYRKAKSLKTQGFQRVKSVACMEGYLKTPGTENPEDAKPLATAKGSSNLTQDNIAVSLRVVRGPDWKWGEEDGGGQTGIILAVDEAKQTAQVLWESTGQAHDHYRFSDLAKVVAEAPTNLSKLMLGRRNSQEFFSHQTQTVIIVDWDDTLFPTTYVRDDLSLCWRKTMKEQSLPPKQKAEVTRNLDRCAAHVVEFMRLASRLGKVILVTLARSPWVAESCKNFFPTVGSLIRELQVPVVYAQEGMQVEYNKANMSSDEEIEQFWAQVKGKAIARELKDFYSQYQGQSWKNIISIGDSDFERLGTQSATEDYIKAHGIRPCGSESDVNGHVFKVRTKTFKMVDQPTIEELTLQVEMLIKWVPLMVKLDNGFDVNLNDVEDPRALQRIERTLKGLP